MKLIDISNFKSLPLADSYQLFRSVVPGEGRSYGLGLTVHISDYFWNDLKQHKPIPVDLRIVAGLKYSAFALDIYFGLHIVFIIMRLKIFSFQRLVFRINLVQSMLILIPLCVVLNNSFH